MRSFSIFTGSLSSRDDANVRALDGFEGFEGFEGFDDAFPSPLDGVASASGVSLDGSSEVEASVTTSTLPAPPERPSEQVTDRTRYGGQTAGSGGWVSQSGQVL